MPLDSATVRAGFEHGAHSFLAAVQAVPSDQWDRHGALGDWTLRELVLHLVARDKVRLEEFDRMLGGTHASWIGITSEHMDAINEWHLGELRHLGWEDARRRLDTMREALLGALHAEQGLAHGVESALLGALHAVPAEPAEVWSPEHPFGRIMHALVAHDRHHAAQVKQLRLQG